MEKTIFKATEKDAQKRLDIFLSEVIADKTRSGIKVLIEQDRVLVNGAQAKAGRRLRPGEDIAVFMPPPAPVIARAEEIPLEVLYEDEDVIVVNKQADLSVHPGAGRQTGTLVNALLSRTESLSTIGGALRPGIVHRLDKDTTGVMVVAKNDKSHISLAKQFKDHTTRRRYWALVWGAMKKDDGIIDLAIGRDKKDRKKISPRAAAKRKAVTGYRVLKRFPLITLVELTPQTGRTHQIRVHLAESNHPVVGDPVYGRKKLPLMPERLMAAVKVVRRQCLHAHMLGFIHPARNEYMEFASPVPADMANIIKALEEAAG